MRALRSLVGLLVLGLGGYFAPYWTGVAVAFAVAFTWFLLAPTDDATLLAEVER